MNMDNQTLYEWVKRFRQAAAHGCQDDCTDSYDVIRRECRGTVQGVKATSGDLRHFVDEIADAKLSECLLGNFDPDKPNASFRAYYGTALSNAVRSEARRRLRERKLREDSRVDTDPPDDYPFDRAGTGQPELTMPAPEMLDLRELLETYAERKRKLIDGLKLSVASHMATLLIDQRQRMAQLLCIVEKIIDRHDCPRQTEDWELWSTEDPQRGLVKGLSVQRVWEAMATNIIETDSAIEQQLVVDSIIGLRGHMTPCNWRQRVSRYRADVTDQLDEEEWNYFLFR